MSDRGYELLAHVRRLTSAQRTEAREKAKLAVVERLGEPPERVEFEHYSSKYPPALMAVITILLLLVMAAAFVVSAQRMYHIAYDRLSRQLSAPATAQTTEAASVIALTPDQKSQVEFGASALTVLSEGALFVFMLAVVFAKNPKLYIALAALSAGLAISANVTVAIPKGSNWAFDWIEAFAPPMIVMGLGWAIKEIVMTYVNERATASREFENATRRYNIEIRRPEESKYWQQEYANALVDAIMIANSSNTRLAPIFKQLDGEDWAPLVGREMASDDWADRIVIEKEAPKMLPAPTSRNVPNGVPNGDNGTPSPDVPSVPFDTNGTRPNSVPPAYFEGENAVPPTVPRDVLQRPERPSQPRPMTSQADKPAPRPKPSQPQNGTPESREAPKMSKQQFYNWYDNNPGFHALGARGLEPIVGVPKSTLDRWIKERPNSVPNGNGNGVNHD